MDFVLVRRLRFPRDAEASSGAAAASNARRHEPLVLLLDAARCLAGDRIEEGAELPIRVGAVRPPCLANIIETFLIFRGGVHVGIDTGPTENVGSPPQAAQDFGRRRRWTARIARATRQALR